jgi:hypothetical protein
MEYISIHGVIGLALFIWFMSQLIFQSKKITLAHFFGITAAVLCMVQRTIYWPLHAAMIAFVVALVIMENNRVG